MKVKKKTKTDAEIPAASMSDIAFPNVLASIGHGQGEEGVLETLQVRP